MKNWQREYLIAQVFAYITTGVFLTTSDSLRIQLLNNHPYELLILRYLGHLLIAAGLIIIVSTIRPNWRRRVAVAIDTMLFRTLIILTVLVLTIGLLLLIIQYGDKRPLILGESSILAIMVIVEIFLIFYIILDAVPVFNRRRRNFSRIWRVILPGIPRAFFLIAILFGVAGVIDFGTQAFPPEYFWGPVFSSLICMLATLP